MIEDEENMDQGKFHISLIPTLCLNASNGDFLCGEDIPIHSSLVVEEEIKVHKIQGMNLSLRSPDLSLSYEILDDPIKDDKTIID